MTREEEERWIIRRSCSGRSLELSDLPESVLSNILYKLPLKTIFRSKSVSKAWLSHISSPLFARGFPSKDKIIIDDEGTVIESEDAWTILFAYTFALGPCNGVYEDDLWPQFVKRSNSVFESPNFSFEFLSDAAKGREDLKAPIIVVAVSNGLILSTATELCHDCYYVSNPLTKQCSALPKPSRIHKSVALGFIVEPFDGSFQVLRIGRYQGCSILINFEIFSSKTHQWMDKVALFDLPVCLFDRKMVIDTHRAVPCKKIIHWMDYNDRVITCDTSTTNKDGEMIRCGVIDLPVKQNIVFDRQIVTRVVLGVCQDKLRFMQANLSSQILSIWELTKYNNNNNNETWVLLHRIKYGDLNFASSLRHPVAFHPSNPDIVYLVDVVMKIGDITLASLHLRSRVCKKIYALKDSISWWEAFPFIIPPWPTPVPS